MKHLLLILLLGFSFNCLSQVLFEQLYNDGGIRNGRHVEQTFDNGYIITGFSNPSGGMSGLRASLIKVDSLGNVDWANYYDFGFSSNGFSVAQTNDSGYVFTGSGANPATMSDDLFLYKVNQNGNLLWTKQYGDSLSDNGFDIKENQFDGSLVIAGLSGNYPYLLKCNTLGDTLWTKKFMDTAAFLGLDFTSSNDIVLCGIKTANATLENKGYVVKVDQSGNEIWSSEFSAGWYETYQDIKVFDSDSIVIVGITSLNSYPKLDGIIRVLDSSGVSVWSETFDAYGTMQNDNFFGVALSMDGYVAVGTSVKSVQASEFSISLSKFDKSGILSWNQLFGNFQGGNYGYDVCSATDGGYVISGQRTEPGGSYLYLIKVNEFGNTVSYSELPELVGFEIYPNPTSDKFTVSFGDPLTEEVNIDIFTMDGRKIKSISVPKGNSSWLINRENLDAEVYLISVSIGTSRVAKKLIIK